MADNVTANSGSGGATFAADDIGGVHYPRTKLVHGADGVNAGDVAAANPLPVTPRTPNGDSVCDDTNDAVKIVQATASLLNVTEASAAAIKAAVEIVDDWDESDRCKVNLIAGQVGVSAGAGSVAANTPRVTLGSDDPAAVSLAVIDDWDESDRCKTNPIVGQAGVAGGSGTVGATTQRVCLATDVALPAGTALLGKVSAGVDVSNAYDGTTSLVPKFAKIGAASSGNNSLVAAVPAKKIRVLSIAIITTGSVSGYFTNGAGGADIFADATNKVPFSIAGVSGFVLPFNPVGWFETSANTALVLNLSAAIGVAGSLTYVEV